MWRGYSRVAVAKPGGRGVKRALLFQLDGGIPNIALMRIAAHHRSQGHDVELRQTPRPVKELWDAPDFVYGSAIFEQSRGAVEKLLSEFPDAIVGGTGVQVSSRLEDFGITTLEQDYSVYPRCAQSIGFTQRGCRLRCSFCVVPRKEGAMRPERSVWDIWRGDAWPRELILLDNDFFGNPHWEQRISEIRQGRFRVSFCQGINARFLTDEAAAAIASVDYRANNMRARRIYTAWDNRKDEDRLFAGLERLVRHGVKPDEIMVYMLVGYWPGETAEDRLYRQRKLREFGCRPYPMPYVRTRELTGFQRWVVRRLDLNVPWPEFEQAGYRSENLGLLEDCSEDLELALCT